MQNRIFIDLAEYEPLTEGGLRPPQHRLSSLSHVVQEHVRAAFGPMMPSIVTDHKGVYWYENLDRSRRDTVFASRELKPEEEIPPHELLRLLQGWQNLQAIAEGITEQNIRLFLLCFQIPDPVLQRHRYRLYRDNTGKIRLHVLWGFFPIGERQLSWPVDEVLATLKVDAPKRFPVTAVGEAPGEPKPEKKTWFIWSQKKG